MIWTTRPTLQELAESHRRTAVEALGIEFTEIGDDFLAARMPVDGRTRQPYGILHGGASVLLAETLGSCAAAYCLDRDRFHCVGLDINANHLCSVSDGWVHGRAEPVHLGRSTHVWQIDIRDAEGRRVCLSRITMAVMPAGRRTRTPGEPDKGANE